jgi:KDEL-tailed cysteine endopeptidase
MKLVTSICALLFQQFVSDYGRVYDDPAEYKHREQIFCDHHDYIQSVNSKNGIGYQLAINQYADWTDDEFLGLKNNATGPFTPSEKIIQNVNFDTTIYSDEVPESWDWRDYGHVSAIKNQSACGSCWSFSTTGVIESHLSIYKNISVLLSEQELVDCSTILSNHGCNGGNVNFAFMYIQAVGLSTEQDYPYVAVDDKCQIQKLFTHRKERHFITGWKNVYHLNETRMLETIYNRGPISVCIAASSKDFRFYRSGILDTCDFELDHDVLIVGFGVENGVKYFIVKNSWGANYGENGYIRIKRGGNGDDIRGVCGIHMMSSFPVVD